MQNDREVVFNDGRWFLFVFFVVLAISLSHLLAAENAIHGSIAWLMTILGIGMVFTPTAIALGLIVFLGVKHSFDMVREYA